MTRTITLRDLNEVAKIEKNLREVIKDKWFFNGANGDTGMATWLSEILYDNGCDIVKTQQKEICDFFRVFGQRKNCQRYFQKRAGKRFCSNACGSVYNQKKKENK